MHTDQQYRHLRIATLLSLAFALVLGVFVLVYGKHGSFFLVHTSHSNFTDHIFWYLTYAGDGLVYIPLGLYCIFFRRDFILPLIIAIIISTILTHFLKRIVFPDELRPISLEIGDVSLRRVLGLKLHRMNSFPSGHAATAFTAGLLLVAMAKRRLFAFVLPVIALLVAYSRVYLGQHYVTDILAGIGIGIVSAYSSLLMFRKKSKSLENGS